MNNNSFATRSSFIKAISEPNLAEVEKLDYIVNLCKGRRVLDLGCIDHSFKTALELGDQWLHAAIKKSASSVVGLDILEHDAYELNKLGFDIKIGNAEAFELSEKFDVIVAGDLIEHLSNIGSFLEAVKKHMHPESIFVFTTPNPFNIEQFLWAWLESQIQVHKQHTVWINPDVCWELLERHGLKIHDFSWINTRFRLWITRPGWRLFVNRIAAWLMHRHPLLRRDFAIAARIG